MRVENEKRRKTEEELLSLSTELERQRDNLDAEVKLRTKEIALKAADLERINAKMHHTNQEQAEFTYAISHDLKSPTNTIGMLS